MTAKARQLPFIKVVGDNWERGYSHGVQCSNLIRRNIIICKELCKAMRKSDWQTLLEDAGRFIKPLKKNDWNIYQEFEGIAAGAGVSIEEIVFLNVRTDIHTPSWNKASLTKGCTSLIIGKEKTVNQKVYAAQTWDWIKEAEEVLIILNSDDGKGHQSLTITEAGIIGSMGINNQGLVTLLNFLYAHEINTEGAPYHVLLKRALDSRNVFDAQRKLSKSPIAFAVNVMLADINNSILGMELTSRGIDYYRDEKGYILHTNHFVSDLLKQRGNSITLPESMERYNTAQSFIENMSDFELNDVIDLFTTHVDTKFNICRHFGENSIPTLYTVIFELTEMQMYLSVGHPCENAFINYDLNQIFKG